MIKITVQLILLISFFTNCYSPPQNIPEKEKETHFTEMVDSIMELSEDLGMIYTPEMAKKSSCQLINIGDVEVCIPLLTGMQNCYDNPKFKNRIDQLRTEGNIIYAYFMNDSLIRVAHKNPNYIVVSDCIKVFSLDKMKDFDFPSKKLDVTYTATTSEYKKDIFNKAVDIVDDKLKLLEIDQPVIIDEYQPHKNIRTAVLLMRSLLENKETYTIMVTNVMSIKRRLLYFVYYYNYVGPESLAFAKSKSDFFGLRIIKLNTVL